MTNEHTSIANEIEKHKQHKSNAWVKRLYEKPENLIVFITTIQALARL